MSEYTFPASVQMAIGWVDAHLLHPAKKSSRWPRPTWSEIDWFTSIRAERIRPAEGDQAQFAADYWNKPLSEFVERDVAFILGNDEVARVTMRGMKGRGHVPTCWDVAKIYYDIMLDEDGTRVEIEDSFLGVNFTRSAHSLTLAED